LQISFEDRNIRKICEKSEFGDQELGNDVARILRNRISDIRAAEDFSELILGNLRVEKINEIECYFLDLANDFILIMSDNDPRKKKLASTSNDWLKVTRVKIMNIQKVS